MNSGHTTLLVGSVGLKGDRSSDWVVRSFEHGRIVSASSTFEYFGIAGEILFRLIGVLIYSAAELLSGSDDVVVCSHRHRIDRI